MDVDISHSVQKKNKDPSIYVDLSEHGRILAVHFSTYEWSQDVILIAFKNKIFVGQIHFEDNIELRKVAEFHHADVCTAMCLSPETSVNILPLNVQFCTAGNTDFTLRIFKGNLANENVYKVLKGHKNYINDISYDVDNNYIASVSDDCTARVWRVQSDSHNVCQAVFYLKSPGISTGWHREDRKLMVAEKNGTIRFYNINMERPILSLNIGKSLSSAHWAPSDSQLLGSLNMGELVLWDVAKPSCQNQSLIFTQNGGDLKFSPLGELVAAVNKLEGFLKVTYISSQQVRLSAKVTLPTNVSWHFRLPIVCIGDDRKLCFWEVFSK